MSAIALFVFELSILLLVLVPIVFVLIWLGEKALQTVRDIRTRQIAANLDSEECTQFFLYLRPFFSTGKLRFERAGNTALGGLRWFYDPSLFADRTIRDDFETSLRSALEPTAPIIALGRPGEHIGVGRFETTDENWKSIASRLMDRAALIFLVPGPQSGTVWEIERILSDEKLLLKTFFVSPPGTWKNYRAEWEEVRVTLAKRQLWFPAMPAETVAFKIFDGRIVDQLPLLDGNPKAIRKCLPLSRLKKNI